MTQSCEESTVVMKDKTFDNRCDESYLKLNCSGIVFQVNPRGATTKREPVQFHYQEEYIAKDAHEKYKVLYKVFQ